MNKCGLGSISNVLLASLLCYAQGAIVPPPWADPNHNPCASQPGGWQLIYWPADKKCYRIFQRGYPCPETMELSPGPDKGTPECNCPPGSAQHNLDSLCYPIFQQGPCEPNQYFAPEPDRPDRQRLGRCVTPEPCPDPNSVYHPRDKRCHQKFTKGPCPEGQLITSSTTSPLLGECRCDPHEMADFYWAPGATCHAHYTTGPCQERGGLFLPGGQCGCNSNMPHWHNGTSRCYQLGGLGPCAGGHQFSVREGRKHAECMCRDGYVKWSGDGVCYRPYTRGPCAAGHMYSVNHTSSGMELGCIPVPCSSGKLYFPGGKGCHRVGTQGPCPPGQLVLFQDSVKTSVEGISYLGMCGCPRYNQENTLFPTPFGSDGTNSCGAPSQPTEAVKSPSQRSKEPREDICVNKRGMITWHDGTCRPLYAQGPCNAGEWVVPDRGKGQRQGRGWWKGKCECRPGYTVTITTGPDNENKTLCQAPTVVLAKFLNNKTNSYKYKNKHVPPQESFDEGVSTSQNKYTTKLVRSNSKATKLTNGLKGEEGSRGEERTKLSPVRNDRRNSRYKTNWETRELNRMKELHEKSRKDGEESEDIGEKDDQRDRLDEKNKVNVEKTVEVVRIEIDETPTRINDKRLLEHDPKEVAKQETTNEIVKKINAINSRNKHVGASRERSFHRRLNSKELNTDALSLDDQKLLGSSENGLYRRGRKYNIPSASNEETTTQQNTPTQNAATQSNPEEEAFRNLKTIQDDINEYIRQQQEEQEDRLKNHKIVDEDEINTNSARPDVRGEDIEQRVELSPSGTGELSPNRTGELSPIGTEEFDTNASLEVINEASANLRKSQDGTPEFDESGKEIVDGEKEAEERTQQKSEGRTNHRDGDDEFEEGNSTETLIMVEDKKGGISDLSEYDHRKHIKDYVKPIIIFE